MARTIEQDSTPVRVSNDFVDFFQSRKKRHGSVRGQLEYFLMSNMEFKKQFNKFAEINGGDKI